MIHRHLSSNAPDPESGIVERIEKNGVTYLLQKRPRPWGDESMAEIDYAVSAMRGDEYVLSIAIEALNLRLLSSSLGCDVRELRADYGVKGHLTSRVIKLFIGEREDEIAPFKSEKTDDNEVYEILMEIAEEWLFDE